MNIDKGQILELLRSQGQHDKASQADESLPEQVDTDNGRHQDLLSKLGIDVQALLGGLGGSGGLGGLGGGLGKKLGL